MFQAAKCQSDCVALTYDPQTPLTPTYPPVSLPFLWVLPFRAGVPKENYSSMTAPQPPKGVVRERMITSQQVTPSLI